eukprot:jgi/Astpho2/2188/fgenesh1_pg.00040_%23_36_t
MQLAASVCPASLSLWQAAAPSFHIENEQQQQTAQAGAGAAGLHKVALTLPPPARRDPAAPDDLPQGTQMGLSKLMKAVGLQSQFEGGLGRAPHGATRALREFMPAAAELSRQREAAQYGPRHQISLVRTALRMGRQVSVGFSPALQAAPAHQQLEWLEALARALDAAPDLELSGLAIQLGLEGSGIDQQGSLWLQADAHPLQWTQCLQGADLQLCRERRQLVQRVKQLESAVAGMLGLAMVYTHQNMLLAPEYRSVLEALAAAALDMEPGEVGVVKGSGRVTDLMLWLPKARLMQHFRQWKVLEEAETAHLEASVKRTNSLMTGSLEAVPLCITQQQRDPASSGRLNTDLGFLLTAVNTPVAHILALVKSKGPEAAAVQRLLQRRKQALEELRTSVEQRLRLRRLQRDPSLDEQRFRTCCQRLLNKSMVLSNLMEGMSYRISHVNSVDPDGSFINLAWDFEI